MNKKLLCILLASGTTWLTHGQSDFVSVPGSAFLDNIADSTLARNNPSAASGVNAFVQRTESESLITQRRFTLGYAYGQIDSKLSDHAVTENHSVTPDLYLATKNGISLDTSFIYQNTSKEDNKPSHLHGNTYGIVAQPGYDLWRLIHPPGGGTPANQLVLATALGYKRGDSTLQTTAASQASDADTYVLGPSLTFAHVFSDTLQGFLASSYTEAWKENHPSGAASSESRTGLFALQARVDYKLMPELTATLSSTWKHDVDQTPSPGKPVALRDWAEFGASLRYAVSSNVLLKAGYSYEAFRPDYESHNVVASVLISF